MNGREGKAVLPFKNKCLRVKISFTEHFIGTKRSNTFLKINPMCNIHSDFIFHCTMYSLCTVLFQQIEPVILDEDKWAVIFGQRAWLSDSFVKHGIHFFFFKQKSLLTWI